MMARSFEEMYGQQNPILQCVVTTDEGETFPAQCRRPRRIQPVGKRGGRFAPGYDDENWVIVFNVWDLPKSIYETLPDDCKRQVQGRALVPNRNVTVHEWQRFPYL